MVYYVRPEEEWARRVIARHLNKTVHHHDDQSQGGMYDLRVGPETNPEIAIECVQDLDPEAIRVWKKASARAWFPVDAPGCWAVEISKASRVDRVVEKLGELLSGLYDSGTFLLSMDSVTGQDSSGIVGKLSALGVTHVHCLNESVGGRAYFTMADGQTEIVDPKGQDLVDWVTCFIADKKHTDVRRKLARSGARDRHVCIILRISGTLGRPIWVHLLDSNPQA